MDDGAKGGQHVPGGWGERLRRRSARPPARYVAVSVLLHVAVIALLWVAGLQLRPEPPEFEQFRISMISPPPTEAAPVQETVETSTPVQVEPEPTPQEPEPTPTPEPVRTQAPTPRPVEKPPEPKPARGPDPKPSPVGGENLNVVQEGREFLFPEYQEGIIRALNRFFRWTGAPNLEAEVSFVIMRDGRVREIRIARSSGNFAFDLDARAAVEQAGRARAFGPLPEEWQGDRLAVLYTYESPK